MERDKSIDVLRAIAILFVIFGHVTHIGELRQYIWSFHMPLFFFISGFLFNRNKYESTRAFLKVKINGLIIPYIFFCLITLVYWILIESRVRSWGMTWYMEVYGIIYGTYSAEYMLFNSAMWFLPCLFSMELLYWFVSKIESTWKIVFVLLFANILGMTAKDYLSWLPWGINSAMISMIFFGFGNLIKTKTSFWANLKWYYWVLTVSVMFSFQWLTFDCLKAEMNALKIESPFLYIFFAVVGICLYFSLAKLIKKNFILEWIGQNTLVLFALQEPVYRAIIYSFSKLLRIEVELVRTDICLNVLCTCLTVIVIAPFVIVYNKYISNNLKKIGTLLCEKFL